MQVFKKQTQNAESEKRANDIWQEHHLAMTDKSKSETTFEEAPRSTERSKALKLTDWPDRVMVLWLVVSVESHGRLAGVQSPRSCLALPT